MKKQYFQPTTTSMRLCADAPVMAGSAAHAQVMDDDFDEDVMTVLSRNIKSLWDDDDEAEE